MTDDNTRDNYLLLMEQIIKEFPGVVALNNVNFTLRKGEIHVLLGENGAGKSTLIKILSGVYKPDNGQIKLLGKEISITNPSRARSLGISTIYQEFSLVNTMSVADNILLGREVLWSRTNFLDKKKGQAQVQSLLGNLEMDVNPNVLVRILGAAERQMVEIAKSLVAESKIIIMDEPTAALTEAEIEQLFKHIRNLKERGVSIIYITHRLDDVRRIGDRVTVLRDGKNVGTTDARVADTKDLIRMMVGHDVESVVKGGMSGKDSKNDAIPILKVEGLARRGAFEDISFELARGVVLGIAGLLGAGRTELARAIFAVDHHDKGKIFLKGRQLKLRSPQEAVKAGIGLVSEDRRYEGLISVRDVRENVSLSSLQRFIRYFLISRRHEEQAVKGYIDSLSIRTPSIHQLCAYLSGGNQQKVVVAKWLCANCKLLIFDEPTKGIDVNMKAEIHKIMRKLADEGVGIVMISSELPELLNVADQILVMHKGKISALLSREEATKEKILAYCAGLEL